MSEPLVTIGLPCYNTAPTLLATLRSIFAQTLNDWELLAVDDGSTDATGALLASVRDPRVRVIADGQNRHRVPRLNEIARQARGKYLARMDADDLMFPERLTRQVRFLEANPDVDLVGAGVVSIDCENRVKGVRQAPVRVEGPFRILAGEVLYHPTVMGRRTWFCRHPYPEGYQYADDFALWASCADELRLANLPEPLLFYREHGLFTPDKYWHRVSENLTALKAFGPERVGRFGTEVLVLRRRLKNTVYAALQHSGLWSASLYLSNRRLPAAARAGLEDVLKRILKTPVPGLEADDAAHGRGAAT